VVHPVPRTLAKAEEKQQSGFRHFLAPKTFRNFALLAFQPVTKKAKYMLFLALAGITGVCLAFAELRLLAVVGLAVLLFLNPLLTLGLFVVGGLAALYLH
jgi:hypothetical protein